MTASLGPLRDYETSRRFSYRDGKIYQKSTARQVWPDDPGCVCLPDWAEYDELGGAIFVYFRQSGDCPVHSCLP